MSRHPSVGTGEKVCVLGGEDASTQVISGDVQVIVEGGRKESTHIATVEVRALGFLRAGDLGAVHSDIVMHDITLVPVSQPTDILGEDDKVTKGSIHYNVVERLEIRSVTCDT
jgi:hypothetical protein